MTILVIAPSALSDSAPEDWQDQVLSTPGVELVGRTGAILQVRADDDARKDLEARFGGSLNIEAAAPRGFAP